MDININILPNGKIQIFRSNDVEQNLFLLKVLKDFIDDKESLEIFLNNANLCESVLGEEPLCG